VILLVLSIKCHLDVKNIYFIFVKGPSVSLIGDELKQTVSIVVDIASVLDPDGVDVYFLNREPLFHVRNSAQLAPIFAIPPSGMFF
jgi:hypothetical protein